MDQALDFIGRHGASFVLVIIFLDQLGIPIPTIPILLGFGALAGSGRIDPLSALLLGTFASLCADGIWFQLGRWKGSRVLGGLCRIALEPDSCVSKTRNLFAKYGVKSLLVAKFVPGFDTVAPPLAGLLGVRALPFFLWSGAGALVWLGAFGGLGYAFSDRLEALASEAERLGSTIALALAGLVAAYLGWKFWVRQRVLRSIRMARITPNELNELIVSGQQPIIVDVRSKAALAELPFVIEGSLLLTLEEIEARQLEIPRGREVVVYCSCPNELSSARVALKLKSYGISPVRPLAGGIQAWQDLRLPVVHT
jgi:membrane protein DedA with SNARE-associated domain/rhodanese-related sulfurtransferase